MSKNDLKKLTVWLKKDKSEIKLNGYDDTVEMAKKMGWKLKEAAAEPEKDKSDDDNGLDDLRAQYEELFGKKPHHMAGKASMEKAINEALEKK